MNELVYIYYVECYGYLKDIKGELACVAPFVRGPNSPCVEWVPRINVRRAFMTFFGLMYSTDLGYLVYKIKSESYPTLPKYQRV